MNAPMKWVDRFLDEERAARVDCVVVSRVNGWPETIRVNMRTCFSKSMTYNKSKDLYFQGVDPKKLKETGDIVLLCGGSNGELSDIFVNPWEPFFRLLELGEAVNTYRSPKEYWQYKFHLRGSQRTWNLSVQGGKRPQMDISKHHFSVPDAVAYFKQLQ